ncbi:hypothetical protein ANCDUO_22159 [Ancylostoma duodenale]|uniref:Tc1-like transposase DDE domain-containing protein n=1 Tax=Ancylostoma duodenale TaxID=51022 RepID=A0A0C2FS73_9BILA|nr:hypothetical protein ANCDUO_22159 [Ancylostoma duodenale]
MDSKLYCKIIRDYYIPFAYTAYGGRCRLAQDNDPKHISRFTLEHMDHWKIKRIEWPPESPDLNPIEFTFPQAKKQGRIDCRNQKILEKQNDQGPM